MISNHLVPSDRSNEFDIRRMQSYDALILPRASYELHDFREVIVRGDREWSSGDRGYAEERDDSFHCNKIKSEVVCVPHEVLPQ